MVKTRYLFVSHSWTYARQYYNLIRLLKRRPYFAFKNYSVPASDPIQNARDREALYRQLEHQVRPCQLAIVLAGVYASYSPWIERELEICDRMSKPILAVKPWGNARASAQVKARCDRVSNWNTESIIAAIRELS